MLKKNQTVDFDEVTISEHENNYKSKLFLEICPSIKKENCVNYKSGSNQLSRSNDQEF